MLIYALLILYNIEHKASVLKKYTINGRLDVRNEQH